MVILYCTYAILLFTWDIIAPELVVDVNNLRNGRKPVKLRKENPAECAGEGKQSKGN